MTVLELGTGLGVSSLFMAQAVKENGSGHVWTVDDGSYWNSDEFSLNTIPSHPRVKKILKSCKAVDYFGFLESIAERFRLTPHISFLKGHIPMNDKPSNPAWLKPVLKRPIDLLFCDFSHGPSAILSLLSRFLPLMAHSSSFFIDSASTFLPSYLTLERTVRQLNSGKVPAIFLEGCDKRQKADKRALISSRSFTLIHLVEKKKSDQNSMAWIRIEPTNL